MKIVVHIYYKFIIHSLNQIRMENEKNKQVYNPLGYIDLSTIKESGAKKIYKTKSAAKAQATRKKNKSQKKEKPPVPKKLTREEIWWKNRMYNELLSHINDMEAILHAKMNKRKQIKKSPLFMVSDEELNKRIESLVKILNSK